MGSCPDVHSRRVTELSCEVGEMREEAERPIKGQEKVAVVDLAGTMEEECRWRCSDVGAGCMF